MSNEEETKDKVGDLLQGVRYYAIGTLDEKTEKLLSDSKAKKESYLSDIVTHAIVTDFADVEIEETKDVWEIPAVTVKWVELSIKCGKLLPTAAFSVSNSQLFFGLVICPSKLNQEDRDLLWALVTFYGGSCQLELNKSCSHLVVCEPKGAKYEEAIKHPDVVTVVTLDWILDSIKEKQLQDAKKYHPSLCILPQDKPVVTQTVIPESQNTETDVISSSLQSLAVSSAPQTSTTPARTLSQIQPTAMVQGTTTPTVPAQHTISVSIQGSAITQPIVTMAQTPAVSSQMDKDFHQMGQPFTPQPGQQYILTGQSIGQPQVMTMQQFQMQRQAAPNTAPAQRFAVHGLQQQFPNQTTTGAVQVPPTPSPKKAAPKRRRSSAKSKAKAQTSTVPSSPMHGAQMSMMSQQQYLQQQNQQMLQQRMTMMQQGPGGQTKVNFMPQQQMYQAHHFAPNMQGKPQPTSPQKTQLMTPFMGGNNFQNTPMRMQQHQQIRPQMTQLPQTPQMSAQQMMAMGINPQMQQQIQQVKMTAPGPQNQPQFTQQQGVNLARGVQQMQPQTNPGKMQPQRMQISPQQTQAMFMQQQQMVTKEGVSPRSVVPQQHSPLKQQRPMMPAQQMNQQQRQQQVLMQQMAHQHQMQLQQQQLMQTPGGMPPQQKQTTPPTSHTHINVGIGVISPTALQQGLMMAQQNSSFQAPLVHPSLQTPQDYGKVTQQSSSAKSRRSKARKPKDGDENADGKAKPKPRSRQKKSSQSPASNASSPGAKKLAQTSPAMGGMPGYYQTPMNVMTPPPHPTVPVCFSVNKPAFPPPPATVSPLAATENTFGLGQVIPNVPRLVQSPQLSPKVVTRFLPQPPPTFTPPPPHRGIFNDPLEAIPSSYEGKYVGHDSSENVPPDLCLLGCVFVIVEYQETVPNLNLVEHWKKIINKYGGIVEEEYNTCTCTHLLCISQTTDLFKDALLEGKRCVTVYWLNDVLQVRKLRPPWLAMHVPTPFAPSQKPATSHTVCYTGFHQKERERLRMMTSICGCKFSGYLSRSNTVLICKGTLSLKYDKAREWGTSCVNVKWLRDVLHGDVDAVKNPGQAKYQSFDENCPDLFALDEAKLQKILDPWKVPVRVTLDCMQRARVKRRNSISDSSAPAQKRLKTEGAYQPLPRVCFTGLSAKKVAELQKSLESLQGQISKTISLSTHLVAERVSRTVKFLCAISVCQYIVTPQWIEDSAKSNWLLDENKYILEDKVAEEKFDFSLKESIKRARTRQLFKGYAFCITKNVAPDRKILAEIVECAGGKVIDKIPAIDGLKRLKARKPPNNHLILVSCPADGIQVLKWKHEGIPVHNAEIILTGVLKQEVNESVYQM